MYLAIPVSKFRILHFRRLHLLFQYIQIIFFVDLANSQDLPPGCRYELSFAGAMELRGAVYVLSRAFCCLKAVHG